MRKMFNIHNVLLILVVALISVLSLKTKEVKAAGTVTWSGPSSITIRETIHKMTNNITATRQYGIIGSNDNDFSATTNIVYTGSETITNNQLTETAVLNLSNLTFDKPGDYQYNLYPKEWGGELIDDNDNNIADFFYPMSDFEMEGYKVTVQVRNVVDANNVPTGNFTATLLLQSCEYDDQTGDTDCTKVTPTSGVLYANFDYEATSIFFSHIEVSKTVKGIGADTNQYFPFVVSINCDASNGGLDSNGWTYSISGLDASASYNGSTVTNPSTITVGTPATIYLKHGQTAIIGQASDGGNTIDVIPLGMCQASGNGGQTKGDPSKTPTLKRLASVDGKTCYGSYYSIQETPGDYTPAFTINGGSFTSGYRVNATGVEGSGNVVSFSNTKEMSPVTGLILTILPYVILAGIGVGGTLLVMHLKKEEKKVKAN